MFGGVYDDDVQCEEMIAAPQHHQSNHHVEDIMIEDQIPEAGLSEEEEECNDEDCEYCRQYYLQ